MKIKIPAQTVEVNADDWAEEYGIEKSEVPEDVMSYFSNLYQQQIDYLGLNRKGQNDE